jgi:demethylmenaquinone methyltransferase/2-methoxy-6-polyprenyl-1,4-benzoquinol methylase
MPDPRAVRAMFTRIAPRYDLLNRLLSGGVDRRWRRRLLEHLGQARGLVVVDACCGTGDLSVVLEERGARVLGVDFTPAMLVHARRKRPGAVFVAGDALRLPVADGAADAASIAFGLRNVADRTQGLRELARIVRPGGQVLVLEFSLPPGRTLGALYRFYFTRVLPRIGALVSRDPGAYRYLPDTVLAWPTPAQLCTEMQSVGLEDCGYRLLTGGIACLSWGRVPERSSDGTR